MDTNDIPPYRGRSWLLRVLLALSVIWLAPTLACGSFAPRPTATPTLPPVTEQPPAAVGEPQVSDVGQDQAAATPADAQTPTPAPTATFTPTPLPGTALAAGQQARVTAPAGLNYRDVPNTDGQLLGQFGTGQLVNVLDGPVQADDFTWWQIDDRQGNVGWAADGDGETEWLSPQVGEPQPANRPPNVGDRVQVTMGANAQLTIRSLPGTDAALVTRVNPGTEFTVVAGPQSAGGYNWYQIRSDDGTVEGWAAEGDGADRWLSPLE
ncbi:MAG: SH3 domain-containing protein [Caldilineaceae bacterium]|jgi:uncharacterized protein YgiM (DUF1202 family)